MKAANDFATGEETARAGGRYSQATKIAELNEGKVSHG